MKGFVIINVQKLFGTLVDFPVSLFFTDKPFLLIAGRFRRESKKVARTAVGFSVSGKVWKFKTKKAKHNYFKKLSNRYQYLMYRLRCLQNTNLSLLTQVGILVISHDKPPQT